MTSLPEEQPEQPREDSTTQLFRSWDCENWAESQSFFQLTLSYVCVSPVDHLAPSGKTLRDIAIVTGLLLQCSFQHCDTPYISTSLEFAVKFGLKCWYFHLIFSVLSFDKCMFTIGSCGLTFYCFHGGRALHSYTHTHTHTCINHSRPKRQIAYGGKAHLTQYICLCVCGAYKTEIDNFVLYVPPYIYQSSPCICIWSATGWSKYKREMLPRWEGSSSSGTFPRSLSLFCPT